LVAAAPVTILGGYDHYAGALGQRTNSYLAGAAAGIGGGDLALVGMRYDDNQIGLGYGITGTAGLPIAPSIELRVLATRFIGDESFRAWRARVGPQFGLPGGGSLTLSYVHYEDNLPAHSNGVMGEASAPVTGGLTGRLSASCATSPQGPAALQGAVGLGWRPVSRLEISGEVGATRNGTGVAGGSFPGQHDLLGILPLGNGGGSTPGSSDPSREVAATALVGVRVFIP
jgi:hypothetical protein